MIQISRRHTIKQHFVDLARLLEGCPKPWEVKLRVFAQVSDVVVEGEELSWFCEDMILGIFMSFRFFRFGGLFSRFFFGISKGASSSTSLRSSESSSTLHSSRSGCLCFFHFSRGSIHFMSKTNHIIQTQELLWIVYHHKRKNSLNYSKVFERECFSNCSQFRSHSRF